MQSEMSHAHIQFKGRLGELMRRLGDDDRSGESSISSSEYEDPPHFPSSPTSTTATTTSTTTNPPSFDSTLRSFSHRQFDPQNDVALPGVSNLSSRRRGWFTFKFSSLSSMATPDDDLSLYQPREMTKKKPTGKQKREELEREVSTLRKLLSNERKVHDILESVHNRKDGSPIYIPNFLPPKVKELLAEIVMVEGEIALLQSQIRELQNSLDQEKEVTRKFKNKQEQFEMSMSGSYCLLPSPLNAALTKKGTSTPERLSFETKALHFISKAIKGDYNLNNFSTNDKMGSSRELSEQKENSFREEIGFQEKVPRKSGLLKPPPSPLRDPRHPTPVPRERSSELFFDLPLKPVSRSIQTEEISQKWQPNKLSESIMKCLLFIFVRLIRTSRTMELEKSGPISRSIQYSSNSVSFRVDTSLNPKASPLSQRDSRQQDPYGIFDIEESIPRDIGPYKNLVRFTSSSLDPKCISNSNSIPLLQRLRVLMNNLQKVELRSLTYEQKLAFWINMYNACIMHGFLQYGVPSSPEKLLTLMNKAILNIGGNIVNAQAIEHFILRKQAASGIREAYWKGEKDDKEAIIRELYGVEPFNPNVTFALCCGTRSSPAVKIYTAEGVVAELERSKLEYLQASIVVASTKRIAVPELLFRNMLDFAQDAESLVKWVCHHLPTSGSLRKSIVDFYRSHNTGKISNSIENIPYEFEFQYLLSV